MPSYDQKKNNKEVSVIYQCNPVQATAGNALNAVIGSLILPTVGYASIAAAAGTLAAVAAAAATGGAILLIPHYFLARAIANNFAHEPIYHFCLQSACAVATAVYSGLLGAAILGMVANPVGLCVYAGSISLALAILACKALSYIFNDSSNNKPPKPPAHVVPIQTSDSVTLLPRTHPSRTIWSPISSGVNVKANNEPLLAICN